MISKSKIRYLFFNNKLRQTQIAQLMGVSKQYINKVIKKSVGSQKIISIRKMVLKRDDNRCQFCFSKVRINIHHIDGNHDNNNTNNMICLCLKCHQWVHDQVRKQKIKSCG